MTMALPMLRAIKNLRRSSGWQPPVRRPTHLSKRSVQVRIAGRAETEVGADLADLCASTATPRLTSLSSAQGQWSQSRYGSS
jgi:hypothetical protein